MKTVVLDKPEDLKLVYDGIAADFDAIEYEDILSNELNFLAELHKSFFDASTGPDGQPWAVNAPSTIRAKGHAVVLRGKKGTKPASVKATKRRPSVKFSRAKGIAGFRLATSLTAKTTQSFGDAVREAASTDGGAMLKFGTTVEYSLYNDQGTDRIPARPHIGMTSKYLDEATNRVADYTLKALAK
jgi:hypothetical protein